MGKLITVSITDIVASAYCEQKVVLDRKVASSFRPHNAALASSGEKAHKQFEREGLAWMGVHRSESGGHDGG